MNVITCTYASYSFQALHCARQRSVYVADTAVGSVKVCSLQIKQMFIVAICVQKNKHSSNPLSTPLTEQSVFVGPACTLNYAYLPCTQWDHWTHGEVWGGQGSYASLAHSPSPPRQRGQAEIRSGVLCFFSFSSFTKANKRDTPGSALMCVLELHSTVL